jgi:pimeloyl-ACP methyl ester carboxylesterase
VRARIAQGSRFDFPAQGAHPMNRITRFYATGRWGQIHGRRCGEAGPTVVLLHQSPLSSVQFAAAMPFLAAEGVRAVALDTPGYGMSDGPPAPVEIADYAEALVTTLDNLGIEKPVLVGHHTGAAIAARFAAAHPSRVEKLVLNGVPLFTKEELEFFAGFKIGPTEIREDGSHFIESWQRGLKSSPGWDDLRVIHRSTVEALAKPDTYWWAFAAAFRYDIAPDLMALAVPTLVFTTTGEDLYAASKRAHALRPDVFRYAELQGGNHNVTDSHAEAWAKVVAGFAKG